MNNLVIGGLFGAFAMFLIMHRIMVIHINKWRCGTENPRKWSERDD